LAKFQVLLKTSLFLRKKNREPRHVACDGGAEPKQAGRLSEFYFLKCIFIVFPRGKQHIKNKNELDVVSVQEHFEAQL